MPPTKRHIKLLLHPDTVAALRAIGGGNLSEGLRRAAAAAEDAPPAAPDVRVNVTLDDPTVAQLQRIGGTVSGGARRAAELVQLLVEPAPGSTRRPGPADPRWTAGGRAQGPDLF